MKPRLVDTFCKAGGCTKGYQDAGFYVVGVDIEPQPNYCGDEFIQADALEVLADVEFVRSFDAAHASPPCQAYSRTGGDRRRLDHPDLVDPTRELLMAAGVPWVIENIPGAPLRSPVLLCGATFGLPIIRHRLFESPWLVLVPHLAACRSSNQVTAHAGGPFYPYARGSWESAWREHVLPTVWPWMTLKEAGQAIPPAYTEWIGAQLLTALEQAA